MKILSIVFSYYPKENLLNNNVCAFINHVEKVLIWENTPDTEKCQYRFIVHDKVEYCGDGINSISHALNYAWHYAQENGFDYLLTMDQDSVWENFQLFLARTVYSEYAPVGIWTPQVIERKLNNDYEEILQPITSGMLIKTDFISNIGGWNEIFSIDCVDDEFILKARLKGYKTYIIKDTRLKQNFGTPYQKNIFGRTRTLRNYPPKRLFNIFKNNIILIRLHPDVDYIRKNFRKSWLLYIIIIVLFEKDKKAKIVAVIKGIVAGLKYKI